MIVPDLNLLLYAHFDCFPLHESARLWWSEAMNGADPVGLAPPVLVFTPPMSVETSLTLVKQWLARDHVQLLVTGPAHLQLAFGLLRELGTAAT